MNMKFFFNSLFWINKDKKCHSCKKWQQEIHILPLGMINIKKWGNSMFNVFDMWGNNDDCFVEVWKVAPIKDGKIKYKIIFSHGEETIYDNNETTKFIRYEKFTKLFVADYIESVSLKNISILISKYWPSLSWYVYK